MSISVRATQKKLKPHQKRKSNANSHVINRSCNDDSNNNDSGNINDLNNEDNAIEERKKSLTGTMRSIQSGGNKTKSYNNSSSSIQLSEIINNYEINDKSTAWKAKQNEEGLKIERQRVRKDIHNRDIDTNVIVINSIPDGDDEYQKDQNVLEIASDDEEHDEHLDFSNSSDTESGSGSCSSVQYDDGFGDNAGHYATGGDLEEGEGAEQGTYNIVLIFFILYNYVLCLLYYYDILKRIVFCILRYHALYGTILYCTVLYCTVLYYAVVCLGVPCCAVMYCIVLY